MTCPDWENLGPRDDADTATSENAAAWAAALEHFDGCEECRDRALAVEPTLLFRKLPPVEVDRSEIDAMKLAVRNLRRAEAIEKPQRRRREVHWLRAAALATLLVGSAFMLSDRAISPTAFHEVPKVAAEATAQETSAPAASQILDLSHLPVLEEISRPHGGTFQLVDGDLSVVVVEMPKGFDV